MAKYVMKRKGPLVIFFKDGLRTFNTGDVVGSVGSPHEWFELIDPPKPKNSVRKETPPKIHLSNKKL